MAELRRRKYVGSINISTDEEMPGTNAPPRTGPHAIQIVAASKKHKFKLEESKLTKVLMQEEVRNRNVVVISVAGAFRKGKSFILDFFLKYLNFKYVKALDDHDWLGPEDVPLEGFTWRGGSERETTGIQMWSEIFLAEVNDEEVAIILLDTQGTFDSESTVKQCATIFALSTMLSSVQVFNLSQNIQEDDLQHLQLFTEYGKLALADSGETPFQKLQFLVRDWSYPYEADYGAAGGKQILDKRLAMDKDQHRELYDLRQLIKKCFSDISCFLMPHPGLNVATCPTFDGKLKDISDDFKKYLKILVPMLLAPENLIVKKINGQKVKAQDLVQYFKAYIQMYSGDDLPEPKSMLIATAEANNLAAKATAVDMYNKMMQDVCGGNKPFISAETLELEHVRVKDKCVMFFATKKKMGGKKYSQKYEEQLLTELEDAYAACKAHNDSKHVFKAARTPAVFFAIAVLCYITSGVFGLVGMYSLANLFNMAMGLSFITLCLWAYIRYSGQYTDVGTWLDELAIFAWENLMKPVYKNFMEKSVQQMAVQAAEITINNATSIANGKPHQS